MKFEKSKPLNTLISLINNFFGRTVAIMLADFFSLTTEMQKM